MSQDRIIRPETPLPAHPDSITGGETPDLSVSIETGARLLGVRPPHFRKLLRDEWDTASGEVTGDELAELYARLRPDEALITDSHFTDEEGRRGVEWLAERMDRTWKGNGEQPLPAVYEGDALQHMDEIPASCVQTVVTSPPYWGARVYPDDAARRWADGQYCAFGGEQTPEAYIRHTVEVFERLRRVLREDACVWWNVADVRNTRTQLRSSSSDRAAALEQGSREWTDEDARRYSAGHEYLRDTHPTLIPARIARALERAGWYVRSTITWEKKSVVPGAAPGRPANTDETVLLVSPSSSPKFDEMAWRQTDGLGARRESEAENLRNVWRVPTANGEYGHAAPFSPELPARCLLCSTDEGDLVYDPFIGSGSTAVAAEAYGRRWIGSEVSTEYVRMADRRLGENEGGRGTAI